MFFVQYSVLSNYADNNNLFVIGKNKEDIKSLLLLDFEIVNNWFYENFMILNPEKSHYVLEKILMIMKCLTLITLL